MGDAESTKLAILEVSSRLFNTQGYKSTSISDITKQLGYTKGAIYRHFKNKSHLEQEALIFQFKGMIGKLVSRIKEAENVEDKMQTIFDFFISYASKSPLEGGCPLMNAAIESVDTNAELNKIVAKIIKEIDRAIFNVLQNGVEHGQIKKDAEIEEFATIVFASLEGAIMLSRSLNKASIIKLVIANLKKQFKTMLT